MLRGGALPDVNGPAGSILWLWLDNLFSNGKNELVYSVKVLGGAPDIDPAGDELRKTTYSYENLYRAWRALKSCSTPYVDPSGTRFDSTIELLIDNYVIDAYAYWTIDKMNRPAWLIKQSGIKATNTSSGADFMSRPLCRPPPEGMPLALFDEYRANDDLLGKTAAQTKTISEMTAKMAAMDAQLERLGALVASHPGAMEQHANDKVVASMQTFQAQYVALQLQLAHVVKARDENAKTFEATLAAERQNNASAIKAYEMRITDLQVTHTDRLREIQTGLRAQIRKADEDNERTIRELQQAASVDKERMRREIKGEFDRTLARHAQDVALCAAELKETTARTKKQIAELKKESDGTVERAKEEVLACKQKIRALLTVAEGSRDAAHGATIREMQEVVSRFDDKADRSCIIM